DVAIAFGRSASTRRFCNWANTVLRSAQRIRTSSHHAAANVRRSSALSARNLRVRVRALGISGVRVARDDVRTMDAPPSWVEIVTPAGTPTGMTRTASVKSLRLARVRLRHTFSGSLGRGDG